MNLDHVRSCDCSVCRRRGGLMHRVPFAALRLFTPMEDLTIYEWRSKTARDYFCPRCGVLSFRKPSKLSAREVALGMQTFEGWAVNVRCLEGVVLAEIPIRHISGSEL
ncbi:GFA family protein [Herminiimonas glaciei]|uniref:GFA family protein n=1 Tax=Herminiimonas glaciei TaxID=523788 RepID=A0ABW2I8V6_9BURK